MDCKKLGTELRAERKRRGLSQKAVGIILKCSEATVGRAERGSTNTRTVDGVIRLQKNLLSRLQKLSDDKIALLLENRGPQGLAANSDRDTEIQKLVDGGLGYEEIGKLFGISKQRIGQLVRPFRLTEKICIYCKKQYMPTTRVSKYCSNLCNSRYFYGITPPDMREQKRLADVTAKIAPPDKNGCWIWQGSINNVTGYGTITWQNKSYTVHRWMWERVIGEIPDGVCVLHKCDVRRCANPKHLFLGTKIDNAKDRDKKGRWQKPRRFERKDIITIRAFYKSTSDCGWLAKMYNVHPKSIYAIATGKTYSQIATQ